MKVWQDHWRYFVILCLPGARKVRGYDEAYSQQVKGVLPVRQSCHLLKRVWMISEIGPGFDLVRGRKKWHEKLSGFTS